MAFSTALHQKLFIIFLMSYNRLEGMLKSHDALIAANSSKITAVSEHQTYAFAVSMNNKPPVNKPHVSSAPSSSHGPPPTQMSQPNSSLSRPVLREQASSPANQESDENHDSEGYQEVKPRRRPRRRVIVTGTRSEGSSKSFTGAPEPSRDLFIYRVSPEANVDDIKEFISTDGVVVRDLIKKSSPESRFQSYRLTVKQSDEKRLLDEAFWPEGVRVRRYWIKRNTQEQTEAKRRLDDNISYVS